MLLPRGRDPKSHQAPTPKGGGGQIPAKGKAHTGFPIGQLVRGPVQGLLLLLFPPVAAVVVVVVHLVGRHALQGVLVEVHGVRALRGQRGDGALHGARVRDGLRGTGAQGAG